MKLSVNIGRKYFNEIMSNLKIVYNLPNASHLLYYVLMSYDKDVISYFLTRVGHIKEWENLQRHGNSYRYEEEKQKRIFI